MPLRIEDYGLVGDLHTAALVGLDGSVDWLCLPRVDSGACFSALLGGEEHGRWSLAPAGAHRPAGRRYRPDTLVLETDLASDEGAIRLVDCMPPRDRRPELLRIVQCVQGRVRVRSEIRLRFDYGHVVPWLRGEGRRVRAFAGPEATTIDADVEQRLVDDTCVAEFDLAAGRSAAFRLAWTPVRDPAPPLVDAGALVGRAESWWRRWTRACTYRGDYRDAVVRSLITLKALSYRPSGGIVAAPTTSLPEQLRGVRNWDYRYCWLRDATFTLMALLSAGYVQEATAWREWLLRTLAGRPEQMQIMYGVEGERRLTEIELDWLPGYADSRPVRVGNAASAQFQLDVYGELMDSLHRARAAGIGPEEAAWHVQCTLLDFLEGHWRDPDNGIWEMRGPRRDFTYSKVMAWVGVDRAIGDAERLGLPGPVEKWKRLREEIFTEVCDKGYDAERGTFTQYYGSTTLDAALLRLAPVGFLPAHDPRMKGTVAAVEKELCQGGFVQRYTMDARTEAVDGLPPGEGAFLPCTFWLADNYVLQGRRDEARRLFERLLDLRNDLGLLAEEYDQETGRLLGNFPQAFSHVPLVNTAYGLADREGPVRRRRRAGAHGRGKG